MSRVPPVIRPKLAIYFYILDFLLCFNYYIKESIEKGDFMNLNFLCCIGAELKNSVQQTTRMTQVYLYRAFEEETIADMLATGFFNDALGIIRQDDLLLLYSPNETVAKWTYARVSNVDRDGVVIKQIGINATAIAVDTTGYSNLSGDNLQEIMNNLDTLLTTMNDAFVRKDGTSIMSAPLKFVAGSLRGGIGPSFGGVEFYTLNNDSPTYSLVALGRFTTSGFIPHVDNTYDIGSTARKWKDLYIARVIAGVLNNGADISVPTVGGTMALVEDIYNKITNCTIEIPQDIKLELNNGTVTLKAGSKAYKPDGTTYSASTDTNLDNAGLNGTSTWVIAMTSNNRIFPRALANCVSGAGATTTAGYAYDTTTNIISWYSAGGVKQDDVCSFPIAIIHTTNGVPDEITQVFNGIGYIGSTAFVLPNVKGLNPQGLNADGTLNNTTVTISSVMTRTLTTTVTGATLVVDNNNLQAITFRVFDDTPDVSAATWCYSIKQNKLGVYTPSTQTWSQTGKIIVGTVNATTGGAITSLNQKTAFHAVDYNDSEYIAHCAMPSDRYIDLTLGNDNDPLTAPADGYYMLNKASGAANERVGFLGRVSTLVYSTASSETLVAYIPVSKGETVRVRFTATGATNGFRFIYANGSK